MTRRFTMLVQFDAETLAYRGSVLGVPDAVAEGASLEELDHRMTTMLQQRMSGGDGPAESPSVSLLHQIEVS